MKVRSRLLVFGLALLALVAGGGEAVAQVDDRPVTLLGRVTDDAGRPVVGAFVTLIDDAGTRIAGTLADDEGGYVLRGRPGAFRLRAERIGIDGSLSERFEVGPGEVKVVDLTVIARAISLEGVEVSGEARCDLRRDGGQTMAVWDEARKALDLAAWTDEMGLYTYTSELWQRQYDTRSRRVVSEQRETRTRSGRQAFRSIAADSLEQFGYIIGDDDDRSYFAPDAEVLLSDSFLRTHCFRTVRDDDVVGLEFEPLPDRDVSDIEGTIWLDEDGLLDRLEFEYTRLDGAVRSARTRGDFRAINLGGTVRFEALDTGGWIVREWNIRMPSIGVELDAGGDVRRRFLSGIVEVGGEVLEAEAQEQILSFGATRGSLRGVVLDSVGGRGLANAIVYLSGAGYSATTNEDGVYAIDQVREGVYDLIVEHPRRTELAVEAPTAEVLVLAGGLADAPDIAFPARRDILTRRCQGHRLVELEGDYSRQGETAVVGGALLTEEGEPIADGRVRVRWMQFEIEADDAITEEWSGIEVRSDARGAWHVCGVPNEVTIDVGTYDTRGRLLPPFRVGRMAPGDRIWVTLERENR